MPGNDCDNSGCPYFPCSCYDHMSSSDWLFGLWPDPPQRFEPTGNGTYYQNVQADYWPYWGHGGDLAIGYTSGAPGVDARCSQGGTYRGTPGEICGGFHNWGATNVEVWYPPAPEPEPEDFISEPEPEHV
eukprot:COSAG04_NODE_1987_length_5065_cov_8.528393_2_plen_130_part_00